MAGDPAEVGVIDDDAELQRLEALALTDPQPFYAHLRHHHPVFWHEGAGSWFISRHEDVAELLVDQRLVAQGPQPRLRALEQDGVLATSRLRDFYARWLAFADGDYHRELREAIRPVFASGAVRSVGMEVAGAAVARLAAQAEAGEGVDLLTGVARPLTADLLGRLLGLDADEVAEVVLASDEVIAVLAAPDPAAVAAEAEAAVARFEALASRLVGQASWAATLVDRAGAVDPGAAVGALAQTVTGAVEPSAQVAAGALITLGRSPHLLAAVREGAASPGRLADELIRTCAPFTYAPRVAIAPIEVRGQVVAEGDRVLLLLLSANGDEAAHPDGPDACLRAGRTAHVAFGRGAHHCLGAPMAQSLVAGLVGGLADLDIDIELTTEPTRLPSFGVNGYTAAPARPRRTSR